jgi:hypothetical protein
LFIKTPPFTDTSRREAAQDVSDKILENPPPPRKTVSFRINILLAGGRFIRSPFRKICKPYSEFVLMNRNIGIYGIFCGFRNIVRELSTESSPQVK